MDSISIEDAVGDVSKSLKISDKRAEELKDLCCDSVVHYKNIAECMDVMQSIAKNHNELAYCNYRIGVCSRCPGSIMKREEEKNKDINDKLDDIWNKED